MTSVQVNIGSESRVDVEQELSFAQEEETDYVSSLRAKEVERLSKDNRELIVEVRQLRALLVQAKSADEKIVKLEGHEASWKLQMEKLQAELEVEQQRSAGLEEQLGAAKLRQEEQRELLDRELRRTNELRDRIKKVEIDAVTVMALDAQVKAHAAEYQEALGQLEKSDKVRQDLLRTLQDRTSQLDSVNSENQELREYERSRTAQVVDLTRDAAEAKERLAGLGKQLQNQEAATKSAQQDASAAQEALAKSQAEVQALLKLTDDLQARVKLLETEVEKRKAEQAKNREELARLESAASERELALKTAQQREAFLNEQVSQQQLRADVAQAALLSEKANVQQLEGELQSARSALAAARAEKDRVLREAEAERLEHVQRMDKKVAQQQADIDRLEEQMAQRLQELGQRNKEFAELEVQFCRKGAREAALELALEEAQKNKDEAQTACLEVTQKLQELAHSDKGVMTSRRRNERRTGSPSHLTRPRAQEPVARNVAAPGQRGVRPRGPGVSEPLTLPGRRTRQDCLESSSTFASSSRSDKWQEQQQVDIQASRRHEFHEPIAGMFQEPWTVESRGAFGMHEATAVLERPAQLPAPRADGGQDPPCSEYAERMNPERCARQESEPARFLDLAKGSRPALPAQLARLQESSLKAWERHLADIARRQILSAVWYAWASPAKVSALRARLELVLLDELRLSKACDEVQKEMKDFFQSKVRNPELWAEVLGGPAAGTSGQISDLPQDPEAGSQKQLFAMKSFIFEFRKRVAEAIAELPGALHTDSGVAEGRAFQKILEIGRGSFGRLLHASLFLYQKLRTLVPSELEETMRDPVSRLVPVPFYTLPYKFRLAVHRGIGVNGLARGLPVQRDGGGASWHARLHEMQDLMPLCASPSAIPFFLAQLLALRCEDKGQGTAAEPRTDAAAAAAMGMPSESVRDGLDQLAVDALTVYMSGWRLSNSGPAAEAVTSQWALGPRGRSLPAKAGRPQPRQRQGRDLGEPKLRLGPDRAVLL